MPQRRAVCGRRVVGGRHWGACRRFVRAQTFLKENENLWTATLDQAALVRSEGISISTIYYSGNTTSTLRAGYAAKLAQLTGGTGVAMVAPTTSQISGLFAGFCSTMSSALKAVY